MHGGVETKADTFQENLVCVINNGPFAAAAYADTQREWEEFKAPDSRPKKWFILPNASKYAG